jgi:dolichol-phosphate mannosyltransferase
MRALILGGSGAIGSAAARHACAAGVETHVALRATSSAERLAAQPAITRHDVELAEPESVAAVVRRVRPDWILMAAFPVVGHATHRAERRELLAGMCSQLLGVMEALALAPFAGTLTWLGSAMANAAPHDGAPATFRGTVKAAESLLAARMATDLGVALTQLRVFTGYGPFEQRERFVASLLRAGLDGGRVALAPQPARRDWVHYDDIAAACLASAAPATTGARVFDVCSGRVHDTRAVATLLEHIVGRPLISDQPYAQAERYGDATPGTVPAAGDGLDWAPRFDLAQGLAQSWDWARSAAGRAWLLRDASEAA